MKLIDLKRRFKRFDLLDFVMIKTVWIIIGIIIATYFLSIRGFVEQNIWVVVFLLIVIAVRPMVRFWKS